MLKLFFFFWPSHSLLCSYLSLMAYRFIICSTVVGQEHFISCVVYLYQESQSSASFLYYDMRIKLMIYPLQYFLILTSLGYWEIARLQGHCNKEPKKWVASKTEFYWLIIWVWNNQHVGRAGFFWELKRWPGQGLSHCVQGCHLQDLTVSLCVYVSKFLPSLGYQSVEFVTSLKIWCSIYSYSGFRVSTYEFGVSQ